MATRKEEDYEAEKAKFYIKVRLVVVKLYLPC